ncbi:FecCD family ABC transporter permease [Marinitenerispora sediminis]|uniref:Iron ABC transporter permease n=1 Tax=Marinitenerispora sediminis TaxID=1931232 RepID=A0A368SZR9_9ACTN|nr:iron ABC transporter permease [Marinitenerispora sediminis]RCV48149.1 iron ABC transporter permease [Marinitenerispora sediminis]RCV49325.1 iron ABC transporter permease [Marinitenerispora sediminis]RCV51601.1 iron ABC transporter permease [Marinitenerispora sediminis]
MTLATENPPGAAEPAARRRARGSLRGLTLLLGVAVSLLAVGWCVTVGTSGATLADVWHAVRLSVFGGVLTAEFEQTFTIITNLRLPRALLAFAAGAALSLAGVVMQGLLRNPLVSPFTLGVSPAAAFGASLAILATGGAAGSASWLVVGSALAAALAVSALVLGLASARSMSTATLLLLGIALTQLFEAMTSALQFVANENTLQAIVRWTFGSVNDATWREVQIVGAVTLLLLPVLLWFAKDLNAVAFAGDDAAKSLGVNVTALRVGLIVLAVLLASVVVSFCGVIGFVGLVGPHIARLVIGADHRFLLPFSFLTGGLLLLVADTIGRTVLAPSVIPVGIVVAFIGAPVFINLILTRRAAAR